MKNTIAKILIPFSLILFIASPILVSAAEIESVNITEPEQILQILERVVQYVYTAFFIIAVLFILLAAYDYIFAQGDPTRVGKATKSLSWAMVAIAVALIATGASQIIKAFITP